MHNVNFYDNKVAKGNGRCACLSTLLLDFVVNADSILRRMQICNKKEKDNEHN